MAETEKKIEYTYFEDDGAGARGRGDADIVLTTRFRGEQFWKIVPVKYTQLLPITFFSAATGFSSAVFSVSDIAVGISWY